MAVTDPIAWVKPVDSGSCEGVSSERPVGGGEKVRWGSPDTGGGFWLWDKTLQYSRGLAGSRPCGQGCDKLREMV